jgi:hypothetical protein
MGNESECARGVAVCHCVEEIGLCLPAAYPDNRSHGFLTNLLVMPFYVARQLVQLTSELMEITTNRGLEELDSRFTDS